MESDPALAALKPDAARDISQSWRAQALSVLWLSLDAKHHREVVHLSGDRQDIAAILAVKD